MMWRRRGRGTMENDLISRSALWTDVMMLPHNGDIISSEEVEQTIVEAPAVEAVPVERLGKLGKLMMPYKGCPRGPMGRMGSPATMKDEAFVMDIITDVDGGKWIPVQESVLHELVEGFEALRPKGRWGKTGEHFLPYQCTNCGEKNDGRTKFCPECGAKMEGA